jgi:hypothetical protein
LTGISSVVSTDRGNIIADHGNRTGAGKKTFIRARVRKRSSIAVGSFDLLTWAILIEDSSSMQPRPVSRLSYEVCTCPDHPLLPPRLHRIRHASYYTVESESQLLVGRGTRVLIHGLYRVCFLLRRTDFSLASYIFIPQTTAFINGLETGRTEDEEEDGYIHGGVVDTEVCASVSHG